jgi:hypothetical protein
MVSILKIMIGHIPAFIGPIGPSSQSKSRRYLTPLAAFLWWHGFTDDFYRLGMGGGHDGWTLQPADVWILGDLPLVN